MYFNILSAETEIMQFKELYKFVISVAHVCPNFSILHFYNSTVVLFIKNK